MRALSGQAFHCIFLNNYFLTAFEEIFKKDVVSILHACIFANFFQCPNSKNFCPFLEVYVGCIFAV